MKLLSYRYFEGPNIHCLRPVLESAIDLEERAETRTDTLPHLEAALRGRLPGLAEHHCGLGRPGGFLVRLNEGTYLGHVVEHVALELLALAGEDVFYGKTRYQTPTVVTVVFEAETRPGSLLALNEAMRAVDGFSHDGNWNWPEWDSLRDRLAAFRLGPSSRAIVAAAAKRDIPVARLDGDSLVRLGQGARQIRIRATLTGRTPALGVDLAQDKMATKERLAAAGLPVPDGRVVDTADDARQALSDWGVPVVIKPVAGNHGAGVRVNLDDPDEVGLAFDDAAAVGRPVLVERHLAGRALRLLVVGNQMVAASERTPPTVVGDGLHAIADLIVRLNQDPLRGEGHAFPMSRVAIDSEVTAELRRQGMTLASVPREGEAVTLRGVSNLSAGASARDVTDLIGPHLKDDAVRAAGALGLDVAGVDIVTPDLGVALAEAGGGILEVNAAPGIRMHEWPGEGPARAVGSAIVDYLFPSPETGRIPVTAVTGTNGKTTVARMLAAIWTESGLRTGVSTTDGIYIGGRRIARGDLTGPWSARLLLNDPSVEAAVLETARGGIVRGGLGFDDCDVAVVTNIGLDHLGQDGVEDLDDLVHVKALLVDVVRQSGAAVLNADDERVFGLRSRCRGRVVLFSARDLSLERASGGLFDYDLVHVAHGYLVFSRGSSDRRLVAVRSVPASLGGIAAMNVANAAAAAAAALAAGLDPRIVARALAAFPPGGQGLNQGRLEMLSGPDLSVLIDYGHNAPALMALEPLCRRLKPREIVMVLGLPGDRRDEDLKLTARTAASFADRVVVREDADLRGREPGELAALITTALRETGMTADDIVTVLDEGAAVREAIQTARPGALVVALYERYQAVRDAAEEALKARERASAKTGILLGGG